MTSHEAINGLPGPNSMLINFQLLPIAEIKPWGQPDNLSLHWFGLTDGQYWIEVGENTLFEYSEVVQSAGRGRYCGYQVVRLHEDLLKMLPSILEPVPADLSRYLSGETAAEWEAAFRTWCDRNSDVLDADRFYQVVDAATTWSGARLLDSAYLSPGANIVIWSDTEHVCIEWDNRRRLFRGKPAWTAVYGRWKVPREEFISQVQSFHERLIGQMSERIQEVQAGTLAPDINIDMPGLMSEHERRSRALRDALSHQARADWESVEAAIAEVLRT